MDAEGSRSPTTKEGQGKRGRPSKGFPCGLRGKGRPSKAKASSRNSTKGNGGKGKERKSSEIRAVTAALQSREQRIQDKVDAMSVEELRGLVTNLMIKKTHLVIYEVEPPRNSGGYHPPEGNQSPPWCSCTHCREMPTEREKKCCNHSPLDCISQTPDMEALCLNEAVLSIARWLWNDILALDDDVDVNKGYRYSAYRQFVLWQHHRLGAGNRVVIPSCCVWKIRDRFPDPFGQYVGYIPN